MKTPRPHRPSPPIPTTTTILLGALATLAGSTLATLAAPTSASAQDDPTPAPTTPPPFHLATLFDLGHLLLDENGDGVPDRLGSALVLAPDPTDAERAAAAEITARLGFETMALDLPVRRGPSPGLVGILIGHRAVEAAGLSVADFGAAPGAREVIGTDVGPGSTSQTDVPTIATLTTPAGERWLAVLGDDDDALLRAARHVAGALPHVRTLSGPSLGDVADALSTWISAGDTTAPSASVAFPRATLDDGGSGVHLIADLSFDPGLGPDDAAARATEALDRLQILAWDRIGDAATGPDSADLRFPDLASITVGAGGRGVVVPTLATPPGRPRPRLRPRRRREDRPRPLQRLHDRRLPLRERHPQRDRRGHRARSRRRGRPGPGRPHGPRGHRTHHPPGPPPGEIESAAREPTMVLAGSDHPLIAELADTGKISTDALAPGHGLIEIVPDAFGSKPALVVTGADHAGATLATRRLAEVFPNVSVRGDDTPTFDDIEYELWGTLTGNTPAGQAGDRALQARPDRRGTRGRGHRHGGDSGLAGKTGGRPRRDRTRASRGLWAPVPTRAPIQPLPHFRHHRRQKCAERGPRSSTRPSTSRPRWIASGRRSSGASCPASDRASRCTSKPASRSLRKSARPLPTRPAGA